MQNQRRQRIVSMLSVITYREAVVLTMLYRDGFTQEQVGEALGVDQKTISNMRRSAFDKVVATKGVLIEFLKD